MLFFHFQQPLFGLFNIGKIMMGVVRADEAVIGLKDGPFEWAPCDYCPCHYTPASTLLEVTSGLAGDTLKVLHVVDDVAGVALGDAHSGIDKGTDHIQIHLTRFCEGVVKNAGVFMHFKPTLFVSGH